MGGICYWADGEVGGQVMRNGENKGGYCRSGGAVRIWNNDIHDRRKKAEKENVTLGQTRPFKSEMIMNQD